MITFLDWQLKMLFFDECWSFSCGMDIDELRQKIKGECIPQTGHDKELRAGLIVQLTNDVLTVRTIFARTLNALIRNSYYFTGTLKHESNGFVIHGCYRAQKYRRAISLFLLNLSLLLVLVAVSLLIVQVSQHFLSSLQTPSSQIVWIGVPASVGIALGVHVVDRLMTIIEKIGRRRILAFLESIALRPR